MAEREGWWGGEREQRRRREGCEEGSCLALVPALAISQREIHRSSWSFSLLTPAAIILHVGWLSGLNRLLH